MAWCKKIFYEFVACVCLKIGTIFLVIAFFMALAFLLGVLALSFLLLELKTYPIMFLEICFNRYYRVCDLI